MFHAGIRSEIRLFVSDLSWLFYLKVYYLFIIILPFEISSALILGVVIII